MDQLTLFRDGPGRSAVRPDADSEDLLDRFLRARLAEGAHPQSVRREMFQLRALIRDAGSGGSPVPLRALLADPDLTARLLREPAVPISRATVRARLLALQRFIRLMATRLDRDPAASLAALDARLPARRVTGWHATGTVVGGTPRRRRRRGPTLDAADLYRLVDAAGEAGSAYVRRDRVLVALHCFSGLRPEEIVRLCWVDLARELSATGRYSLVASVERRGSRVSLLLPGPPADAIDELAHSSGGTVESLSGSVFCARNTPGQPLSYRAARDVLRTACLRAGFPLVEAATLRAAFAHWLRAQGLSDHEVAAVLGLARVRSVDQLLRYHAAIDAQRAVREFAGHSGAR